MKETWKSIPGYPEYEASTEGRIRSIERDDMIGRHRPGTVLSPSLKPNDYLMLNLRLDGVTVAHNVHRLIALTFIPNPENKPEVNHINSIRDDNRVVNLEWVTKEENTAHRLANNPDSIAKKAREEVIKTKHERNAEAIDGIIFDLINTDMKFKDIAAKYGKHGSEVSRCNVGQRYFRDELDYPLRKRAIGRKPRGVENDN